MWAALASLLACSPGGHGPGGAGSPDPNAALIDDFGPAPTFSLTDQHGQLRTHADLAGKVWVADFIFTSCPNVCPTLTAKMADLQGRHPGLSLVSFSVDPKTDTPPVLLAYAQLFRAGPTWHFLTGPIDDVRRVVVDGFKMALESTPGVAGGPDTILHGERFVIVDKAGHMRGFPEAQDPEVERLLAALK
ncbi:MAG: SCO family protein [Myxococcales bacterium]|nr:SCO family protein [Myxococcales bacterium]